MCELVIQSTFIHGLKYKRFEEVDKQDLVVGVKYLLKNNPSSICYYSGIFKEHHDYYQVFEHVIYHTCYISSASLNNRFNQQRYYQFVSQKERIQQAMEQRALDIVLKRLVNNDFMW